jgi:hypothetical protein
MSTRSAPFCLAKSIAKLSALLVVGFRCVGRRTRRIFNREKVGKFSSVRAAAVALICLTYILERKKPN